MVTILAPNELVDQLRERVAPLLNDGLEIELATVDQDGQGDGLERADALLRWSIGDAGLRRVLESAPKLRWIHSGSAGVESLPMDELQQRDIVLTNAAGVYAIPIAEWVLTAMLMGVKQAHAFHDAQREHRWTHGIDLEELCGKTLLILGLGGIGREIARRAAGFDMRIWGVNRSGGEFEHVERVIAGERWRDVLGEVDFVAITLPHTPDTRAMIGAEEIRKLKPSAWIINVGRGAVIDEPAMLQALQNGELGGAAIDAWVEEPLPSDHPAWTTPNLIIWPHNSGSSPENTRRGLELFVDNVRRYAQGEDLRNVVDYQSGY